MEIDAAAPAVAHAGAEVEATVETVWDLLTDIDRWPEWTSQLATASLKGPLAEGTPFVVRFRFLPGSTLTSRLCRIEPYGQLAWTGRIFGTRTIHVCRLQASGERALIVSEASWEGVLVRVFSYPLRTVMRHANAAMVRHLKLEAEHRARLDDSVVGAKGADELPLASRRG